MKTILINEKQASSEAIQPYVKLIDLSINHKYTVTEKVSKSLINPDLEFEQDLIRFVNGQLPNGETKLTLTFQGSDGKVRVCEMDCKKARWTK